MKKSYLIILFSIATIAFGQSRQDKALINQLDKIISNEYQNIAPGCVVLVAKNGQVLYQKAFGVANIELNVPMRPEMIFRIGSITKQFTAVAILQLVDKGALSLNDSIQKFIKDFPSKGHLITIENLLTQTSGHS